MHAGMLCCRHSTVICSSQTWLMQEQTFYTKSTRNSRTDPCQKRNLMVRTHPKLVPKMWWAPLVTDSMGLSGCAASTVGSLTHIHFYWWRRYNRSIRQMTEEENLRKKHRRQAIRICKKGQKEDSGAWKKKRNGQKKNKNDVEVTETDEMCPCRTEHTSSSWSQEMI